MGYNRRTRVNGELVESQKSKVEGLSYSGFLNHTGIRQAKTCYLNKPIVNCLFLIVNSTVTVK